jgi:hypothetical protein
MKSNSHNRKRAFAEVVTVDAWHKPFGTKNARVSLHTHVVFGTARVGGEEDSPVRFRLRVKRADIVVVVPPTEPVRVDKASVSRDTPKKSGQLTEVIEKSRSAKSVASGSAKLDKEGIATSATVERSGDSRAATNTKLEITTPFRLFVVTQSQTAEGDYQWRVETETQDALDGSPWDANEEPRLKLVDKRTDPDRGIAPSVRIEVRCKREDLIIDDFELKDESLWNKLTGAIAFKNRLAAAESYIRDRLAEEGLEVQSIEDKFGELTLARVTAEPN